MSAKRYELEFEHLKDGSDNVDEEGETRLSSRVSEVFLPRWHYPSKADVLVKVSHGKWKIVEEPGPSLPSGESDAILKLIWDCGCPLEDGGSDAPGNGSGGSAMDDESAGLVRKKEGAKVKHTIVVTRRGHRDPRGRWEMPAKVGLAVLVAGLAYLSYTLMSSKT